MARHAREVVVWPTPPSSGARFARICSLDEIDSRHRRRRPAELVDAFTVAGVKVVVAPSG